MVPPNNHILFFHAFTGCSKLQDLRRICYSSCHIGYAEDCSKLKKGEKEFDIQNEYINEKGDTI